MKGPVPVSYQSLELLHWVIDGPSIGRVALLEAVGKRVLAIGHRESYNLNSKYKLKASWDLRM